MGLPYPGGPSIQQAARTGTPTAFKLPRAWLPETHDFSFSGLKTAVLRIVQKHQGKAGARPAGEKVAAKPRLITSQEAPVVRLLPANNLAASFQEAVVEVLVEKTCQAAEELEAKSVSLAGGVAANESLRSGMAARSSVPVHCPPLELCTDNAAIVASVGYFRFQQGGRAGWDLDVVPGLRLSKEPSS